MASSWQNSRRLPRQTSPRHRPSTVWSTSQLLRECQSMHEPVAYRQINWPLPGLSSVKWNQWASYTDPQVSGHHRYTWYPKHLAVGGHEETTDISTMPWFPTVIPYHTCRIFLLTSTECRSRKELGQTLYRLPVIQDSDTYQGSSGEVQHSKSAI